MFSSKRFTRSQSKSSQNNDQVIEGIKLPPFKLLRINIIPLHKQTGGTSFNSLKIMFLNNEPLKGIPFLLPLPPPGANA